MRIGGAEDPAEVGPAAWERLAAECGLGSQIGRFVRQWSGEVAAAAEELCSQARAEGWHRPVIDSIVSVCRERAGRLIDGR
jgi:hypothetical protein